MSHHATVLRGAAVLASVATLTAVLGTPVAAKVAPVVLADLTRQAEFVGVVRVDRVSVRIPLILRRRATASVLEGWKGQSAGRVTFGASLTWACDISDANEGEEVVAFVRDGRLLQAGRGRMPIFSRNGRRLAAVWTDVRLPVGLGTEPGPDPAFASVRAVGVDDLRQAVAAVLSTTAAASGAGDPPSR
jgi:hypothetical protein